jgi:ABC-type nitrate/sulfonate/bicarbonate transport system permease component
LTYQGSFQAANLYATILFVVVEAVLLTQALNWVERRACARFGQAVVA